MNNSMMLAAPQDLVTVGAVTLNEAARVVTVDGSPVSLTPSEYGILRYLMKNANKVIPVPVIYEAIWNEPGFGAAGTIAVHIRHLREKIEDDPSKPQYIKVVWGHGYKFAAAAQRT